MERRRGRVDDVLFLVPPIRAQVEWNILAPYRDLLSVGPLLPWRWEITEFGQRKAQRDSFCACLRGGETDCADCADAVCAEG
jgi:hypothetical protein